METKRPHYVPQFYQRYFLPVGENTFWIYDKDGGEPRRQSPLNTAVDKSFALINTLSETPDGIEKELSRLENIAKPIFDRWQESGAIPEPHEIGEIAFFLAVLYTRVPRMAEFMRESMQTIFQTDLERLQKNPEEAKRTWEEYVSRQNGKEARTLEDFQNLVAQSLQKTPIKINKNLALAIAMTGSGDIAGDFLTTHWCLCKASEPLFFITCDAPVVVFNLHGSQAQFGGGLTLPNVEITFPISPKVCLLLDHKRTQKRWHVSKNFIKKSTVEQLTWLRGT